jgi:hypothetical protein
MRTPFLGIPKTPYASYKIGWQAGNNVIQQMGIGYQRTDRKVIDYKLWYLEDIPFALRGPRHWTGSGPYFTFIGAAQTFGRFAPTPYPQRLCSWTQKEHINFGFAGAGPEFFLKNKSIIERVNQSAGCFLQVMSGRSVSTKLLTALGNGGTLKFNYGALEGKIMLAVAAYEELIKAYPKEQVIEQIAEARTRWLSCYENLLGEIRVPTVLVRISSAPPLKFDDFSNSNRLLGPFPQLVNEECVARLVSKVSRFVDCVFESEVPQLLLNYTTRRPEDVFSKQESPNRPEWSRCYNTYYPSPSMHMFVADRIRRAMDEFGIA